MAGLKYTATSRRTAANILATTLNIAARKYLAIEDLIQPFLTLCQDTDIQIRKKMIKNCHHLIPSLKSKDTITQILSELITILKEGNTLSLLVIELVIINNQYLNTKKLKVEFIPLLAKELNNSFDLTNDWILLNFNKVIYFFMQLELLNAEYSEILKKFLQVDLINKE
jgi:hypothetical protein